MKNSKRFKVTYPRAGGARVIPLAIFSSQPLHRARLITLGGGRLSRTVRVPS